MFFDFNTSFKELDNLRREIDSVFNRNSYSILSSFPLLNVYETNDDLKVVAELAGLRKEDIDITLNNDILTLSGNREEKHYGEKVITLRKERSTGEFSKNIRLPVDVEKDKIMAKFSDGILTITLPKAEKAKPKKIMIQA